MLEKFLQKTQELNKNNEPFAIAMVVRREAPSSGKTGDKAVINQFGELTGWIGGGCVKSIIIKEAEDAMKSGKPRLVKIGNSLPSLNEEGVIEYKMTCHSEGTVEVYIEPVLPAPHLLVIGNSAIARSLVKLGIAAGYRVTAVAPDVKPGSFEKVDELITQLNLQQVKTNNASFIVVATQGEQDEKALEQALSKPAAYVGFVSSVKKKNRLMEFLVQSGLDKKKVESIHSPAGIDINAKTPEQVAVSILAEIVRVQNSLPSAAGFTRYDETREEAGIPKFYINPVCGVPVDIKNPKHVVDYKGELVYFCCDGCKVKFDADPKKYMEKKEKV
jgi:xanthine dehydrogenase accessory factor